MRFDTFLLSFLSTVGHFSPVGSQGRRCKDIPERKGMSDFLNFGCTVAKGTLKLILENICEGEPCPGLGSSSNSICTKGNCIDHTAGRGRRIFRPIPAPAPRFRPEIKRPSEDRPLSETTKRPTKGPRPVRGAGKLIVEVIRAEIPDTDVGFASSPDSYAVICVHQGLKRESSSEPITDRDACTCTTGTIEDSNTPSWDHSCESLDINKSQHNSTVITIEIYDRDFVVADDFVGGTDITLLDIIKQGKNAKQLELDLFGPYPSKVVINSTWKGVK